jgi:hypothetical protein
MEHDREYYLKKAAEAEAKLTPADRKELEEMKKRAEEFSKRIDDGSDLTPAERAWVYSRLASGAAVSTIPEKMLPFALRLMWEGEVRRRAIQILVDEGKIREGGIISQSAGPGHPGSPGLAGLRGDQLSESERLRHEAGVDRAEAEREALIQQKIAELKGSSKQHRATS